MKGYNKMLSEIEPKKIICYSEPFSEMKGDIIYVDYELSSWKYLNDNKANFLTTHEKVDIIIKKYGYVCKCGGSAYGGEWKPKDENSARFLGKPNTILHYFFVKGKNGSGYYVDVKYGSSGKAVMERHYSIHFSNNIHSNPHDHEITWENNHPNFGPPINYWDGPIPEFKYYSGGNNMKKIYSDDSIQECNDDYFRFETLGEFKFYLSCGANVCFKYNHINYYIEGHENKFEIWSSTDGCLANGITLEQTLDYEFDGVKLRDFITTDDVEITERIM